MFCSLEEVKNFEVANEGLIKLVKENLPEECSPRNMECFEFEFSGRGYALSEVSEDDVINEGKYENGGTTYQLLEFDKTIEDYPCAKSITNEYDLLVYIGFSRVGSYFTDWEYEYYEPEFSRVEIEIIPEQIIPEHEEIAIKSL